MGTYTATPPSLSDGQQMVGDRLDATGAAVVSLDGVADGQRITGWDGSAKALAGYSNAYIEVTTYGGTAMTPRHGTNGTFGMVAYDSSSLTAASAATITATGVFQVSGVGSLTLSVNAPANNTTPPTVGLGGSVVNLILKR